jgi:methyl coenzyme M reductase subunit C
MIGRQTQVVDCRESMGLAKGGGLAQRGTLSEAAQPDVIAIAMSPGRRHITKPVCEITYGLRREGIQTSVLVLEAGSGLPESFAKEGVKTRLVQPAHKNLQTKGEVVDIVTGVTRGATCTRVSLNTLAKTLNRHLAEIKAREAKEAEDRAGSKKR